MNLPDAYSHPLFNPDIDRQTRYTTRNILCCAIADTSDRNVAVLQVSCPVVTALPHHAHAEGCSGHYYLLQCCWHQLHVLLAADILQTMP